MPADLEERAKVRVSMAHHSTSVVAGHHSREELGRIVDDCIDATELLRNVQQELQTEERPTKPSTLSATTADAAATNSTDYPPHLLP